MEQAAFFKNLVIKNVIAILVITCLASCDRGCKDHASKYSCEYLRYEAKYKVFYWENLERGNPLDERYIGDAKGLVDGELRARRYANYIKEPWDNRAYICILERDGRIEKHRLIESL